MNTETPTVTIDLNAFLEAYMSRAHSFGSLAKAMNTSIPELFDYMQLPEVAHYIALAEEFTESREKLLAAGAVTEALHELKNLSPLPESPTPEDYDRRRRVLDAVRRGADLIRKLYTPPSRASATRLKLTPEVTEASPVGPASNKLASTLAELAKLTPRGYRAPQQPTPQPNPLRATAPL